MFIHCFKEGSDIMNYLDAIRLGSSRAVTSQRPHYIYKRCLKSCDIMLRDVPLQSEDWHLTLMILPDGTFKNEEE